MKVRKGSVVVCMVVALLWGSNFARAEEEKTDQSTPRKTWKTFRKFCYDDDYDAVRRLMGIRREGEQDRRAEQLCSVTDLLDVDPEKLSDDPEGSQKAEETETISKIRGIAEETLRLKRKTVGAAKLWFFHPQTAGAVAGWYQRLEGQQLRDRLPPWLQVRGPWGMARWQWMAIPLVVVTAYIAAWAVVSLVWLILWLSYKAVRLPWTRQFGKKTKRALRWTLAVVLIYATLHKLLIPYETESTLRRGVVVCIIWGIMAVLWQFANVLYARLQRSQWLQSHPNSLNLLPLGNRMVRFLLVALGFGLMLYSLGYSVLSLVAGLGIGGVAVALAAQKTIEQFFGGIVLGVDQPMRVGDLIKVGDIQGYVEFIGLRSTRIRTLDRSIVTIPNGKLADMHIETLTVRDRMRLCQAFQIDAALSSARLQKLIEAIQTYIAQHPQVWPDDIQVVLRALTNAGFDIEVTCWFQTTSTKEFASIRQEILLGIVDRVEKAGGSLAVARRTLTVT